MNKYLRPIWGLGLLLFIFSCNKEKKIENSFLVNAEIEGIESDYLVYYEKDETQPDGWFNDTLWIKDNTFKFEHPATKYEMFYITVPEASRTFKLKYGDKESTYSTKANVNRMWFIGYPGAKITYKGKRNNYMVDAYPTDEKGVNDDLAKVHKEIFPLIDQTNAISVELSVRNSTMSDTEKDSLRKKQKELYKRVKDVKTNFIKANTSSIAGTYFLKDMFYRKQIPIETVKTLYQNLDASKLAGTSFYEEIGQRLEAIEKTKIGMQAPEVVTTNTVDGSEFKLSSLKGNYVLLDYWGTWCSPCMAEMPKIKEYYKKYGSKNFEVIGVNSGDTQPKWKKAIKERNFNWLHIQTTKENDLLVPFNVSSFPTKILIDPSGKIIYSSKNTDSKVDMYQMLDNIFSNK